MLAINQEIVDNSSSATKSEAFSFVKKSQPTLCRCSTYIGGFFFQFLRFFRFFCDVFFDFLSCPIHPITSCFRMFQVCFGGPVIRNLRRWAFGCLGMVAAAPFGGTCFVQTFSPTSAGQTNLSFRIFISLFASHVSIFSHTQGTECMDYLFIYIQLVYGVDVGKQSIH